MTVGPWALVIAVLAYVLKRWWDNADTVGEGRRRSYSIYFSAAYQLAKDLMHDPNLERPEIVDKSYEEFQLATPDFLLNASPLAMNVSDIFFARFQKLRSADRRSGDTDNVRRLSAELNESLGVLRETMKSDLYSLEPRFQIERWRYKSRLRKFLSEEAEQLDKERNERR